MFSGRWESKSTERESRILTLLHVLIIVDLLPQVTEPRFTSGVAKAIMLLRKLSNRARTETVLKGPSFKNMPPKNLKMMVFIDAAFAKTCKSSSRLGAIELLRGRNGNG